MEIGHIIPHIEALIFASDRPLTPVDITELINNAFGFMEDKITMEQVETSIEGIKEKYLAEFYPFELRESGGGWQFLTKKEFHKTVAQLNGEKFLKRLSNAALETLAIIAYKQPITKADIESIRGVSCDYSIQKLLEKELIVITGRNEELPGKPLVYATSKNFMDYFGLNSPEDLPKLKEVFDEAMVNPTTMTDEGTVPEADETDLATDENGSALVVTENGELLEEASEHDSDPVNEEPIVNDSGDLPVTDETENLPEESIEANEIEEQQSSDVNTEDEDFDNSAEEPSEEDEKSSGKSDIDPESQDQGTSD
jgi:segregation and condensation protein B